MSDKVERTESGGSIIRHTARQREFELAVGSSEFIERIEAHIERYVGHSANVFHEIVSDLVHVDIHVVAPTPSRDYYTLVTTGMSDRPMAVPPGADACQYAELLICLPPSWPLSQDALRDEANYWPLRWLTRLARLPHMFDTWLWAEHTVPNGDPPEPYAPNTKLCCALVSYPLLFDEGFWRLDVDSEDGQRSIYFFSFVPLYKEEMEFKLKHGGDALLHRLDGAGVTELLDIRRQNICQR